MSELLYGKKRAEQLDQWKEEEKILNEKYKSWLNDRPDPVYLEDKGVSDKIENHYIITFDAVQVGLGIRKESDLPVEIINDINNSFKKVFQD